MTVYGASGAGGAAGVSGGTALNAGGVWAQRQRAGTKQRADTEAAQATNMGTKKPPRGWLFCFSGCPEKVAERTGLEPATPGVTGRYSDQLNYRSVQTTGLLLKQAL